jgi:hypothetical protein
MIAIIDHKAGNLFSIVKVARVIIFRVAALASAIAIGMVPFYGRWYSSYPPYGALASNTLHIWLNCGLAAGMIALLGSLFGKGVWRFIAFFLAIVELYFWFVLAIAV